MMYCNWKIDDAEVASTLKAVAFYEDRTYKEITEIAIREYLAKRIKNNPAMMELKNILDTKK